MNAYPNKLLVLFPIYKAVGFRHQLSAIDDALVVHRSPAGEYQLELRPMAKLSVGGASSYAKVLVQLTTDLEAGYTVVIVERDQFLASLEELARHHAGKAGQAVERAAQVIAERTRLQIRDHLDGENPEFRTHCALLAARRRRTKVERWDRNGLGCHNGVLTPRAEMLWHVIRRELCDVRSNMAGMAAWERWRKRNRPDMPRAM